MAQAAAAGGIDQLPGLALAGFCQGFLNVLPPVATRSGCEASRSALIAAMRARIAAGSPGTAFSTASITIQSAGRAECR